ncbi:LysE family transporter [Thermosulfuriphilus sp.]
MIKTLIIFLGQVVIISLSGVMAPGPLTAATVGQGLKDRWAGVWITLGHGLIEIPLMIILLLGLSHHLQNPLASKIIGLLGAGILLWMGIDLARSPTNFIKTKAHFSPLISGLLLSAGNPYFLLWWATIGASLITRSLKFGFLGFILLATAHLLCDLIWLTLLSRAAHRGGSLLSPKIQRLVYIALGIGLMGLGISFLREALI